MSYNTKWPSLCLVVLAFLFSTANAVTNAPTSTLPADYTNLLSSITVCTIVMTPEDNAFAPRTLVLDSIFNQEANGYQLLGLVTNVPQDNLVLFVASCVDSAQTVIYKGSTVAATNNGSVIEIILVSTVSLFSGGQTAPIVLGLYVSQIPGYSNSALAYDITIVAATPEIEYCAIQQGINITSQLTGISDATVFQWIVQAGLDENINCNIQPTQQTYQWTFVNAYYTNNPSVAVLVNPVFGSPTSPQTTFIAYQQGGSNAYDMTQAITFNLVCQVFSGFEYSVEPLSILYAGTGSIQVEISPIHPPWVQNATLFPDDLITDGSIPATMSVLVVASLVTLDTDNGVLSANRGYTYTLSIPPYGGPNSAQPLINCTSILSTDTTITYSENAIGTITVNAVAAQSQLNSMTYGQVLFCTVMVTVQDSYSDPVSGVHGTTFVYLRAAIEKGVTNSNVNGVIASEIIPPTGIGFLSGASPSTPFVFAGWTAFAGGNTGVAIADNMCSGVTDPEFSTFNIGSYQMLGFTPAVVTAPAACPLATTGCYNYSACFAPVSISVTCDLIKGPIASELQPPCYFNINGTCQAAWGFFYGVNSTSQINQTALCALPSASTFTVTCTIVAQRVNNTQPAFSTVQQFTSRDPASVFQQCSVKRSINLDQKYESKYEAIRAKQAAREEARRTQQAARKHQTRSVPTSFSVRERSVPNPTPTPTTTPSPSLVIDLNIINQNIFVGFTTSLLSALNATGGNYTEIYNLLQAYCPSCQSSFLSSTSTELSLVFTLNLPVSLGGSNAPTQGSGGQPTQWVNPQYSLIQANTNAVIGVSIALAVIALFICFYLLIVCMLRGRRDGYKPLVGNADGNAPWKH